jgi:nucleotide-binding universal stress UspA family protein
MLRIQAILHPTDFSETANHALQIAHSLARDHKAKLVLVTVAPEAPLPLPQKYQYLEARKEYETLLEDARRRVDALAATITDVPVSAFVECGDPGPAILAVADKCQSDLIIMGTHGRTGVSRVLLGSVAEYVTRHAVCPVLTVKPGAGALSDAPEPPAGGPAA